MNRKTLDPQRVVLIPADDDAVQIGVAAAAEDGKLDAILTITTADIGQFVVRLTAGQLGLLASFAKAALNLDAEQAQRLRDELTQQTDNNEGNKADG